jgi:hypothetical protein
MIGAVLALSFGSLAFVPAAQAGEPPVKTVAKLDAKDPKYDTEACKAVRAKAIDYEEPGLMKKVIGMGGNALVPFAGTAASTALGMREGGKQNKLSKQVAVACVSDPLNEETPLISAPKAAPTPVVTAAAPAAKVASIVTIDAPPASVAMAVGTDAAATETLAATR